MPDYHGKRVTFLGLVAKNERLPKNGFVIGRQIMTCCVDDITYSGLLCENGGDALREGDWIRLTATVEIKNCHLYGKTGPVLRLLSFEKAEAPDELVATFY